MARACRKLAQDDIKAQQTRSGRVSEGDSMKRIAEFCYHRRWIVLVGWVGLVGALLAGYLLFAGEYKTEFKLPGSESQRAVDLLEERGVSERTGFSGQVVFQAEQGVNDPAARQRMEEFFADIQN